MSFYDQVPLAQGADSVPIALEELGQPTVGAPTASYDFVPPENGDVISVHSEENEDVFDSDDEDVVQEKPVESADNPLDVVDSGRPAFGNVAVQVEPADDVPKANGNRYVINDDVTKPRGRCFWCFVIAVTFAVILFVGFFTVVVVVYTQLIGISPVSGNSTDRYCEPPAPLPNGNFTPFLIKFPPFSTVQYSCNPGFQIIFQENVTCSNGKWEGFPGNCTKIEPSTTEGTLEPMENETIVSTFNGSASAVDPTTTSTQTAPSTATSYYAAPNVTELDVTTLNTST